MAPPLTQKARFLSLNGVLLVLLLFGLSGALKAQIITGTILGSVTDSSGALIPGANVTVTDEQTNESFKTITSQLGSYEVPYLKPSTYVIEVAHPGFQTTLRRHINLEVESRLVLNFTLPVGNTATKIDVVGRPPLLDGTTSALGQVISSTATASLPIAGRNIFDLFGMAAGVQTNPWSLNYQFTTNGWTQSDVSISGGWYRENEFLFDGVSITMPGEDEFGFTPTPDDVQQIKVISGGVGPQFGRTGGGTIDVVTKSGTNNWHGTAYDFGTNERLICMSFFANVNHATKAPSNIDLWGGAVGGPIIRNKTFIFATYEGYRAHGTSPGQYRTVPTAAERIGDFSQRLATNGNPVTIYNPFTTTLTSSGYVRSAFPGNIIPTQVIDPVALKMLQFIPLPNLPGTGPAQANNFVYARDTWTNTEHWSVQINHRFSDRHSFFGIVTRHPGVSAGNGPFNNAADPQASTDKSRVINVVLNDTFTISPTSFLNLRYGVTRALEDRYTDNHISLTSLGFPPAIAAAATERDFPVNNFANYSSWSLSGLEILKGQSVNNFIAEMTKIHGRHTLVYGADVRLVDINTYQAGSPDGNYSWSSAFTQGPNPTVTSLTSGDSFASYLTGYGSADSGAR